MAQDRERLRDRELRIPILAPLAHDAEALAGVVRRCGCTPEVRNDIEGLRRALAGDGLERALCLLLCEEAAGDEAAALLVETLSAQPGWSSLPVLFLVGDESSPPPACRAVQADGVPAQVIVLQRPVREATLSGVVATQVALRRRQLETRDLLARLEQSEQRQAFLLQEVRHRTRNTLAVLQALFRLTARGYSEVGPFVEAFSRRLQALTEAHVRLAGESEGASSLRDIFREHVAPYCSDNRQLRLSGEDRLVAGRLAFELSMAVHELATNAAKYGALSVPQGTIEVGWARSADGSSLEITWRERGGPPVAEPDSRRLGSQLIDKLGREAGGRSWLEFRPEGVVWQLVLPLDRLQQPG